MKRPAFQFYPADWRKDAALQGCSFAARGLWHEMMCVMHECQPYGHLSINGVPIDDRKASRICGGELAEYRRLLAELEQVGVMSRLDDGTIYSRRMVRDERLRTIRAQAGSLGGNPSLVGNKDNQKDNQTDKQTPTPSSSSSSSKNNNTPIPPRRSAAASDQEFDAFWASYPKRVGKAKAVAAWKKLNPDADLAAAMMRALSEAKASPDWRKEDGRYIPHPATWINGRRWEDDLATPRTPPHPAGLRVI